MAIFILIFFLTIILGIVTAVQAFISKSPLLFFVSGLLMYIASFLGSMSVGLYILVFPFILWMLAIAYKFQLLKRTVRNVVFSLIGTVAWLFAILLVDDYWLFLPFVWVF
ncbi:hypothetical protein [Pseudalkalibacillus caeni]|uniref:Uncharacterized protein n=1 Tax=Exobacillus caeni TaxID=2574798 RepID=A0A5R9F243_9BACL|nr:hypothetical protein [Pseudalkalibacillus caeni]TLS37141.1 hypothetical protein FCL54_11475 [Pseudalkalibacillus caeni]